MENVSHCKLCQKPSVLRLSHIFPKFLVKWMKDTGTGYLRGGGNFNIRVQDGSKSYMLCSDCEENFSKIENYFASNVFYPIVNDGAEHFQYDERLFKFVASVFWRLLHFGILEEDRSEYFQDKITQLEREWREYLLLGTMPHTFTAMHLLIGVDVVRVGEGVDVNVPDIFIQYMARSLDGGLTDDNIDYSVGFVKLPRFFFLIPVCGFNDDKMINTQINHMGGIYHPGDAGVEDGTVGHILLQRAQQSQEAKESMSPTQRQKMKDISKEKLSRYKNQDLGDIMRYKQRNDNQS